MRAAWPIICITAMLQVLVPGCRTAGDYMTVTEAAGNVIFALDNRPVHDSVSCSSARWGGRALAWQLHSRVNTSQDSCQRCQ
jgi:hypothetical protein